MCPRCGFFLWSQCCWFAIWIRLDQSSEIRIWIRSDQSISNSESGSGWIGVAKYESGSGRIRVYRIQNLDPVGLDFQIQNPGPDLLNKILIGFFTRTYHATWLVHIPRYLSIFLIIIMYTVLTVTVLVTQLTQLFLPKNVSLCFSSQSQLRG